MQDSTEQQRSPQSRVQSIGQSQDADSCSGAHTGESVPRSRGHSAVQRETPRHGPCSVLATGLPLFFGDQLAVDITLSVRPRVGWDGTARSARVDGAVCTRARGEQGTEVFGTPPCWLVSPRGGCSRNQRTLERGVPPVRGTRQSRPCYSTTVAALRFKGKLKWIFMPQQCPREHPVVSFRGDAALTGCK